HDADLVDLRRGGPADGAGPHGVQDRLHECLSAQRAEALGVAHPVGERGDVSFPHLDRAGTDRDRSRQGATAHLVDTDDDAGPGSAVGGQGPFDIQGGDGCAHGCSGTFSKASRPSPRPDPRLPVATSSLPPPRPDQGLTGQKMPSAWPVMLSAGTKPSPSWTWCQAESAEAWRLSPITHTSPAGTVTSKGCWHGEFAWLM